MALSLKILHHKNYDDLSKIYILVEARDFSDNPEYQKPPSKLANAWTAKISIVQHQNRHSEQWKKTGLILLK